MSFARGTTPTISIKFSAEKYPLLDLTEATNMIVTIVSGTRKINKCMDDLDISTRQIDIFLTQRDTLMFGTEVEVQANWMTANGKRLATKPKVLSVGKQLHEKVMENE